MLNRKTLTIGVLALGAAVPMLVMAQAGLVPCNGPECEACHFIQLVDNSLKYLFMLATFLAVFSIVRAGAEIMMGNASPAQLLAKKGRIANVLIGITLMLGAWLIVDTGLKQLFDNQRFGTWNKIQCVGQPPSNVAVEGQGRPTVGGGSSSTLASGDIAGRATNSAAYRDELCKRAAANGIADQCSNLQALLSVESNGNPNAQSGVGAAGLMQLMPSTARDLDPTLKGLSDDQVRTRLKDPAYNMDLGVKLYAQNFNKYNGDTAKTFAAYNGGGGANQPSKDCPGISRYQCQWDSPGCYGTSRTDCTPNTGFKETRNYVQNVTAVSSKIDTK